MKIVWDEVKRQTNLSKRGLDFAEVEDHFDWSDVLYMPAHPGADGRRRTQVIGYLGQRLISVVYSAVGSEAISIISMRSPSRKERRQFDGR